MKFHDGQRMTTSDVQFTLDAVRTPRKGLEHLRAMLDDVQAIELVTPTELGSRLKRPSGWVLRALAEIPILPMHVYDGSLLAGGALVGTGPWKLVSNKGGVVHLARFDKYWGGPVSIADVEFVYQPDAAVALIAAKRGELDIVPALIPAHWPEQATAPGVDGRVSAARARAAATALSRVQRRARAARRCARASRARVARSIAARSPSACSAGSRGRRCGRSGPAARPTASKPQVPEFDPATAGKLLDAAGWTDHDSDGIRDKDGKQLRLVLIGADHGRRIPAGPRRKPSATTSSMRRAGSA